MANTIVWNKHDYEGKMRERLAKPTTWSSVLDVQYSNSNTLNGAYMSTEPSVVAGTRGTAYNYEDFTLTTETVTIDQVYQIPMFVDEADRYQQTYVDQMALAEFQASKISEKMESLFLAAAYAGGTDFGLTDLSNTGDDDTTAITVSAANVDDIIRAIKRKLYANDGVDRAVANGIYIVWRAQDFELLEAFVQANGFTEADISLKNGIPVQKGFRYMGVDHYLSNSHTANHVVAGIKRQGKLGILRGTYGKAKFIEDPAKLSGLGIVSRCDHGFDWPAQLTEFTMDVNVA